MKALHVLILTAASAVFATAADSPVNGKWQIHTSIAGNESDIVCTFTQKDDALTASCTSDRGPIEMGGKVAGNKVTFSYKSEYNGTPLTVNYQGSVDAAKMSGSVSVPEFGVGGDFTATQAKQ